MSASGSITDWLDAMKAGDDLAAQRLWESYFQKLVALARRKLVGHPRAAADEEDVALSAFESFRRGAAENRFPRLADRNDLWTLLVLLTARKACRLIQREHARKRGGGGIRHLSAFADEDSGVADVIGREPTPEFAAQVADECRRRLQVLGDGGLQAVALAKMEGYTNDEIAVRLGVVARTVERRLSLIRKVWAEEGESP
jgi:DNA-directed RNA polymerase specialized sigma24 family protein